MIRSPLVLAVASLALTTVACKDSESAPSQQAPTPSTPEVEPKAEVDPKAGQDPEPAAAPPAVESQVHYAAELEPLLDLVPGGDDYFIAMRDPGAMLGLFDAFVGVVTPTVLERFGSERDVSEVRAVFEQAAKLREALIEAKVDLDKGMLFLEDPGVLIYGTASDDPSAIKVVLEAMGVDPGELPPSCVAPRAMPGYAACGDDDAALQALTPGRHGASFRAAFDERLAGFGAEQGNALFRLEAPTGPVLGAVATPPGRIHVAVGLGEVAKEVGDYLSAGGPDALGMLGPGAAFVWGRVKLTAFSEQLASSPPPVKNVVDTLTGEFLAGGVEGCAGAVLFGVDDPFPASGLVSLASMQTDMILTQLPEGSSAKVEPVEIAGAKTPALHVNVAVDGELQRSIEALKLEPSAWGFSAGSYAGAVFGARQEAVQAVGTYAPKDATPAGLPSNLASALASGDVAMAVHIPLDALQAATVRDTLQEAIVAAPGVAQADPKMVAAAYDIVSPLSSLSMWLSHPDGQRVVHLSIESFADASTDEGKDALATLGEVIAGADPAEAYGALATKYASSPRAARYRMRAGSVEGGAGEAAMSASFLLGAVAGITIPAFTKYVERSKAAAEELSAAERALLEAEQAIEQE